MGKQIHLEKIERLFDKSQVVDFKSIERVVGVKKKSSYAKLLVSNLVKKGKIKKIGKGFYTKHSESSLAVFAFQPAYLGLQCALSHHGVWEQATIPVILTTKKVRRGIRRIMESNVLVRNIDKKYFFGFGYEKEGEFYLPYSDLEKTLIDLLVFNQKISGQIVEKIKQKLDENKLNEYLRKYSAKLRKRVEKRLKQ
jgi:predicted transcriptional regulator of viral defense system